MTKHDFAIEGELEVSIKTMMMMERSIIQCKGLPYFLREIAKLMNDGNHLYKIKVEKQGDHLKGTQAHHKARRKEMVVYAEKDRSRG